MKNSYLQPIKLDIFEMAYETFYEEIQSQKRKELRDRSQDILESIIPYLGVDKARIKYDGDAKLIDVLFSWEYERDWPSTNTAGAISFFADYLGSRDPIMEEDMFMSLIAETNYEYPFVRVVVYKKQENDHYKEDEICKFHEDDDLGKLQSIIINQIKIKIKDIYVQQNPKK
jgi:hypothetical protein